MESRETPRPMPAEPSAPASPARPVAANAEFDPADSFYPRSLMPQIEAMERLEKQAPWIAPEPRRGKRAAYVAVAVVLVAILFGAGYWYDQRAAVPEAPRATGTLEKRLPEPVTPASPPTAAASPPQSEVKAPAAADAPQAAIVTPVPPPSAPSAAPVTSRPAPPPAPSSPTVTRAAPSKPAPTRSVAREPPPAPALPAAASGGVTHTRGGSAPAEPASAPPATEARVAPAAPPPPSTAGCSEQLAALGLCTTNKTGR